MICWPRSKHVVVAVRLMSAWPANVINHLRIADTTDTTDGGHVRVKPVPTSELIPPQKCQTMRMIFDIREPKRQGHEIVGNTKSKGTAE